MQRLAQQIPLTVAKVIDLHPALSLLELTAQPKPHEQPERLRQIVAKAGAEPPGRYQRLDPCQGRGLQNGGFQCQHANAVYQRKDAAFLQVEFVAVLCILGSYGSRGNLFDVFVTVFMGIAAYFMRRMEFPLPPLVIGLVLGQQFEMSIGQMMLFRGDDSWLAFVSASPIAMVLLGMAFLLLVVPQVQNYRALRAKR